MAAKNLCAKTRPLSNPYEVWKSADGTWTWKVLKKWQVDDDKPYARWFCAVSSPHTYGAARWATARAACDSGDSRVTIIGSIFSWANDMAPDLGASCFADLLNAALGEVDWYGMAESYYEEEHADDESEGEEN